ncbi:reverse transcriptase domain-containing protein [Tanacetum coccineum]
MLTRPEKTGRIAKWAIEFGEHDIVFVRRNEKEMSADFLVVIPFEDNVKKEKPKELPDLNKYTYALRFEFETTNNEAECEALLADTVPPQTDTIIKEIHEGSCGFNVEPRSLVFKITKQGYYWPSMHREVAKAIQDCEKCKEQSAIRKARTSGGIASGSTWPFSYWGLHILGPLPMAPRGLQFLEIAVEHSTKFRVPWIISSKEEKHFKEGMFADLCKGLKVVQSFSPITEHMEIMHHIERQLTRSQQGWVDNLTKTLWIHRTLPRNSQKETPFSLTYSSEAMIPVIETTDDRGRVQKATKGKESKEMASIEKAYYQNKLQKYHNARSSHPMYIVGDFVLLNANDG